MPIPLYQVDAFTRRPFRGNPAAVCLLDQQADDSWMQAVAAEMNLSETAFLRPVAEGWDLRWFTPAAEVELCGHATLASAHVLWETGQAPRNQSLRFQTRYRGVLTCRRDEAGRIGMDFPADPAAEATPPAGLSERLGVKAVRTARSRYDWIVEVGSAEEVRQAVPDFAALREVDCRGVAITAAGEGDVDVVSRFFAPRLRIEEDPVTGSLHCVLGPYWSERLSKQALYCEQASPRGGELWVTTRGEPPERVELAGEAVTVMRGELVG